MKRIISIFLVLVLCLGALVGCDISQLLGGGADAASIDDAILVLSELYEDDEGNETPNDFEIVGKVLIDLTYEFSVTWAASDARITIKDSDTAGYVVVDLPNENGTEVEYTLTATVTDSKGNTGTFSMKRVLPVYEKSAEVTSDLEENVAYKIYMNQVTANKHLFALASTQNDAGKYIEAVEDYTQAADFYAEISGEGYKFYTMVNGTKMYINASIVVNGSETSKYLGFAESTNNVWTYNSETRGWYVTIEGDAYVMGTYSNFQTVSISESRHLTADNTGKTQFPASFITAEKAAEIAPKDELVEAPLPDLTKKYTISADNANGALYFNGTLSSGRFNGATSEADAIAITISEVTGGYTLSFKVNGVVTYIVMDDSSTGGSLTTDASAATVFEWNGVFSTFAVADDGNNRAFGVSATSTYANFSAYDLAGSYNWGEFKEAGSNVSDNLIVENTGSDDNGGNEPEAPAEPETPAAGVPDLTKTYTISAANANGTLYFNGTVSSGRFNGSLNAADAAAVTITAVDGGYVLSFVIDGTTKYIAMSDSSTGGSIQENIANASIFEWNSTYNTFEVAEDDNARGFGTSSTSTYNNFSAYALSNGATYNWGQFTAVE